MTSPSETPLDLAEIEARLNSRHFANTEFVICAPVDMYGLIGEVKRLRAENIRVLDHTTGLTICRSLRCMVIYFRGDECPGSTHAPATAPRADDQAAQVLGDPETAEGAL